MSTQVDNTPPPTRGNMIKIDVPLDFSFMKLVSPSDILLEKPRGAKEIAPDEKYHSKSIKLNNNKLQDVPDLLGVLGQVIVDPAALTWIDLSFNELTHIDPVFCEFPNLHILYFHGNKISEVSEVDKLGKIKSLRKLALHGNSMENAKQYRWYVLSHIPQLNNLDMSTVTNSDRAMIARFFPPQFLSRVKKPPRPAHDE